MDPDDRTHRLITEALNEAVNRLDLRIAYSDAFHTSVRAASDYLQKALYTDLAGCDDVIASCIGHTHIDVAWWWTVEQTREKVGRSFATVLKLMEEYPEYRFMPDQDFQNTALSPQERAELLLRRMTLREKVGQLCQRLYGFEAYERSGGELSPSPSFLDEVERFGGLGTLYGLYRADPWSQRNFATGLAGPLAPKAYNLLQKAVIERSLFGIPMLLSSESPHGHQALGGYLLPVNLAVGATFDPELFERAQRVCGKQLREMGADFALVSALDVLRDPRWGRSEECFGEDPCLASRFAAASVRGMQSAGVGMVAKHFCAQGETTGGVNASAARIGERELREIHLPAAEACCREQVAGIMAAYNEIDGAFCHAVASGTTVVAAVPKQPEKQLPQRPPKPSTEGLPTAETATQMTEWPRVLEELGKVSDRLYSYLENSKAFCSGDFVLIDSPNGLAFEMLRENSAIKDQLREAIRVVTGRIYRLGPYQTAVRQSKDTDDPLSALAGMAEDAGIPVKEQKS